MSKQVHCPECQSENSPGSKFCNHCGARLPKSTSVLCPKCQTPNPHNNFYCDNCGGRLHAEQNNAAPEETPKPETSDLPTSAKMFTLPTRDPGDTGELDPASLQNWLDSLDESGKKETTGKLPRLSDLTPEERGKSDDLPGWLLNTENEELLNGSPDDITTEHFLHLIQDINEEEREKLSGLLNDPAIAGDTANLPDWLKNVAQSGQKETSATPPDKEDDTSQPESVDFSDEIEHSSQDSEELPDWLGELEPPKTALLGKSVEAEQPSDKPELEEGTLPDWLMPAPESPETTAESGVDDVFSDSMLFEEDIPDWMLADEQPTTSQQEEPPTEEEAILDDFTLDAAAATSLTGWLAEFDMDEQGEETEETAVSTPEAPAEEVEVKRSLTDWLTVFDEDELIPDDDPSETAAKKEASEESLPDWLTASDETSTETAAAVAEEPAREADDSFNWISDDKLEEKTPAAEESALVDATDSADPTFEDDSFDWLSDLEKPDETEDTSADWLNMDISTDFSLATGDTGPLPDWLDDLEPTTTLASSDDASELESALEDLFGKQPKEATGELEWLDEIVDEEPPAEPDSDDSLLAPLVGAAGTAAVIDALHQDQDDEDTLGDAETPDDEETVEADPEWLAELAAFDPNELVESETEETAVSPSLPEEAETEFTSEFDVEAIFEATESADEDSFDIEDELLGINEQIVGDWTDIDGILAGTADDEALPDWLEQLDETPDIDVESFDPDDVPSEEIPEWVANMRPGDTGQLASALPSALFTESDASELLSDTADLADAELPDWLDASVDERTAAGMKAASGWFDSEGDLEDAPAELEAILADLPPTPAPEDMLQKAEIPAWLEELKPRELTGEAPPMSESRLESSGPLAGMPNTIVIEPIVAMPRAASMPRSYSVSPEQMMQAKLLRQLVQEGPLPPPVGEKVISARNLAGLRILVALLLLIAVFTGLYGPSFLKSKPPAGIPAAAAAVNTAVSEAAGKTVLVAFEYTPAFAGELDPEAEMLLAQLHAADSSILTVSQYTAGTAVAAAMTTPYETTSLGLIPGEAMGLRQLGDCLGENALVSNCTSLHNRTLSSETAAALADVGLIVVLTGERSSLINWVEQVSISSDIPIVIGTTQALEPVVVPYFATTQVAGYLNGLPATIAYQQAFTELDNTSADMVYEAQSLVLLVTAVILLIGGLAFGFSKKTS